jgi:hypothetical protein
VPESRRADAQRGLGTVNGERIFTGFVRRGTVGGILLSVMAKFVLEMILGRECKL